MTPAIRESGRECTVFPWFRGFVSLVQSHGFGVWDAASSNGTAVVLSLSQSYASVLLACFKASPVFCRHFW